MCVDFYAGDRVQITGDAGFARGRIGYVSRVDSKRYVWVRLDGALSIAYFLPSELVHCPLPRKVSAMRKLIDFVMWPQND